MKRVALYVRVSTEEQKKHGLSVDSQIVALRDFVQNNNMIEVGLYNDAGISARKRYTKRPALLNLIEDCKAGKVDLILFTKLDRYFRSVADYYEVQSILDSCSVPWRAIWEDYETETSAGVFKVNIMLSVAQSEADRTSERIKSVFEYKKAQGQYVGSAPYGYMRENNQLVKNPEQEEAVNLVFDTYFKTHSSSACMKALIDKGYIISKSGIARILSNSAYYGDAYGYSCPQYITREQHDQIVEIKKVNYRTPKHRNNTYLFTGLCFCSICGCRLRSITKDGRYRGYYCTGYDQIPKHDQGVYISQRKIEKYLLQNIDELVSDHNYQASLKPKDEEDNSKRIAQLEAKLKRIGIRFEDGDISVEEYKEKREAIKYDIASLSLNIRPSKSIILPPSWRQLYNSLDDAHKYQFWASIIKRIECSPHNDPLPKVTFLD